MKRLRFDDGSMGLGILGELMGGAAAAMPESSSTMIVLISDMKFVAIFGGVAAVYGPS